jgi:hypothetical protein
MSYRSWKGFSSLLAVTIAVAFVFTSLQSDPQNNRGLSLPDAIYNEIHGFDPPVANLGGTPSNATESGDRMNSTAVLLIPESTNDRVMSFDPTTGDLIDPDFIPPDPDNLSTPINAILSADGQSILVSDQIEDVVQEYDLEGNYIGIFAPAGGPNNDILDNIRGMAMLPNGNLLVTVGSGANDDAVAEFDTDGNYVGNFVANGDGGLDSPFDVLLRESDALVGGITSDAIHRYDLSGNFLDIFSDIDSFPEQVAEASNTNILVANFSGSEEGVVEYLADGTLVGIYDPAELGGYRGVYELPNGNILTTNGSGVHEIGRDGLLVETKIDGVSARFIDLVEFGEEELELSLDIRPGSCPNPLNRVSRGVLPVAITGTEDFDVSEIDISTLEISRADGLGGSLAPHEGPPGPHTVLHDVATPFEGELCDCHDLEGDGFVDVLMFFRTPELVVALELNLLAMWDEVELVVSGELLDGTPFIASDCVWLVR